MSDADWVWMAEWYSIKVRALPRFLRSGKANRLGKPTQPTLFTQIEISNQTLHNTPLAGDQSGLVTEPPSRILKGKMSKSL